MSGEVPQRRVGEARSFHEHDTEASAFPKRKVSGAAKYRKGNITPTEP